MENISGKGFSGLPLIMMALAMYLGYTTFFLDNDAQKIYLISPTLETASTKDTIQTVPGTGMIPESVQKSIVTHFNDPVTAKALQPVVENSANKPAQAFAPTVAPQEEIVKNLLEQGEKMNEIAGQTGLKKKEIRKIKRKKKAEERKDKKQRKKLVIT